MMAHGHVAHEEDAPHRLEEADLLRAEAQPRCSLLRLSKQWEQLVEENV